MNTAGGQVRKRQASMADKRAANLEERKEG
jgi:hypothetical protein